MWWRSFCYSVCKACIKASFLHWIKYLNSEVSWMSYLELSYLEFWTINEEVHSFLLFSSVCKYFLLFGFILYIFFSVYQSWRWFATETLGVVTITCKGKSQKIRSKDKLLRYEEHHTPLLIPSFPVPRKKLEDNNLVHLDTSWGYHVYNLVAVNTEKWELLVSIVML